MILTDVKLSSDVIFWLNAQGQLIFSSESMCDLSGYSCDELDHMFICDLVPTFSPQEFKHLWKMATDGRVLSGEISLLRKDRALVSIESVITKVSFEGNEVICGIFKDLSELKKQNEIIQLSYHTLSQTHEMIYWLRRDGSFRYFNDAFCHQLGYSREEVEQMHELDFYPRLSPEKYESDWASIQAGQALSGEFDILRKEGVTMPIEGSFSIIEFAGEELILGILRDITERKQREAALQRQLEENERLRKQLENENILLKEEINLKHSFGNIISNSANYRAVLQRVEQVAETDATVLILGETGTGKELLAKAIHQLSSRVDRPLIKINCGALPEYLTESELFGHEKGAFTGAFQRKIGRFEAAHRGTLFLDEIAELPLDLQVKLLRVLQEKEFERVGGTETIKVDVRVIAATNRNLEQRVKEGKFRQDLYYRLNVFPIENIPLRERMEDLPLLIRHFVEKFNVHLGKNVEEIPQHTIRELMRYDFPGNVRELENMIERGMILSNGKKLQLDISLRKAENTDGRSFKSLDEIQRDHILEALRRTQGRVSGPQGAATLLKINDKTLTSRMQKLGINRRDHLA